MVLCANIYQRAPTSVCGTTGDSPLRSPPQIRVGCFPQRGLARPVEVLQSLWDSVVRCSGKEKDNDSASNNRRR